MLMLFGGIALGIGITTTIFMFVRWADRRNAISMPTVRDLEEEAEQLLEKGGLSEREIARAETLAYLLPRYRRRRQPGFPGDPQEEQEARRMDERPSLRRGFGARLLRGSAFGAFDGR